MKSWSQRYCRLISITVCVIFLFTSITACTTTTGSRQAGWWGSKQDKGIISAEDIRNFVAGIRPFLRDPGLHFRQGLQYQARGQHGPAIEEFNKTLYLDPGHVKALNARGISSDSIGDYETALRSYNKALSLDPELDYVYNNLGYSYFLQGNYTAAIKAFEKAVELDGENIVYQNNLGMAYAHKGEFDRALTMFKKDRAHAAAPEPAEEVRKAAVSQYNVIGSKTEAVQFESDNMAESTTEAVRFEPDIVAENTAEAVRFEPDSAAESKTAAARIEPEPLIETREPAGQPLEAEKVSDSADHASASPPAAPTPLKGRELFDENPVQYPQRDKEVPALEMKTQRSESKQAAPLSKQTTVTEAALSKHSREKKKLTESARPETVSKEDAHKEPSKMAAERSVAAEPERAAGTKALRKEAKAPENSIRMPIDREALYQREQPRFVVHAGTFRCGDLALNAHTLLISKGYAAFIQEQAIVGRYVVRVGPYASLEEARNAAAGLAGMSSHSPARKRPADTIAAAKNPAGHSREGFEGNLKDFPIEVLNGNGVNGMAARTRAFLETKGMRVNRIANAAHFNHARTVIYYRPDHHSMALVLADMLPEESELRSADREILPNAGIRLVLGRDLTPHVAMLEREDN